MVVGTVVTVVLTVPKIDEKRGLTDSYRRYSQAIDAQLLAAGRGPTLVVQARADSPYLMRSYPFIANPPDLAADNLFAVDRGPATIELLQRYPDRTRLSGRRPTRSGRTAQYCEPAAASPRREQR